MRDKPRARNLLPTALLVLSGAFAPAWPGIVCDPPGATCGDEPLCGLKICHADNGDGAFDQADLDQALAACRDAGVFGQQGCNLHLLAATYGGVKDDPGGIALAIQDFPDGFALYGEGQGKTILQAVLYGETTRPEEYAPTIDIPSAAPDGLVIQDLTLDGRKLYQAPPCKVKNHGCVLPWQLNQNTYAIRKPAGDVRSGGIIRRVEIKDYLTVGIVLADADGWLVEDNTIRSMGCHVRFCSESGCKGDELCGPNWPPTLPDINPPGTLNRKANGFGIMLTGGVTNTEVVGNTVTAVTKIGIEQFMGGGPVCSDPRAPRGNRFAGNTVSHSANGIVINGGCDTRVADNTVEYSRDSGNEKNNSGNGFACADGGERTVWSNNVSRFNQGAGFWIGCPGGELRLEDNQSHDNCLFTDNRFGDIEAVARVEGVRGLTIANHKAWNSGECWAGMNIRRYDDVLVERGSVEGGEVWGILARNSRNVRIADIEVSGGKWGMGFGEGLERTYVQKTAVFSGFALEACAVSSGLSCSASGRGRYSLRDGDGVAYCRLERADLKSRRPNPQCCDNLPERDACDESRRLR